jgi:MYXO-CTERM domain-containing protein
VAAFGSVTDFARGCNAVSARDRFAAFLRDVRAPAVLLVGLGFVAIGVSGAIDRVLLAAFGSKFVFGDPPGTAYPASACQHWMSLHPHAASCTQAHLAEAVADVLPPYFATGVLGLLVLGGFVWWSRRRSRPIVGVPVFTATVGAAVFGTAGALLMGYGLDRAVVYGSHGPGQWISAGGVALLVCLSSLVALLRSWRGEAARPAVSSA